MHHLHPKFFREFLSAISSDPPVENTLNNQGYRTVNEIITNPNHSLNNSVLPTEFTRSQISSATQNPFDTETAKLVNEQVGSAMDVDQDSSTSKAAWTYNNPRIYLPPTARQSSTSLEAGHSEQQMSPWFSQSRLRDTSVRYHEMEKQCRDLSRDNQNLQNQFCSLQKYKQELERRCHTLFNNNRILNNQLDSASTKNQSMIAKIEELRDTNVDLKQRYDELRRRYDKKVESYKELDKNYMDLVRPLQVSKDDHSTIYHRLEHIRVSIENLIQKARGEGSANLNKEAAINHFRKSKLLEGFPVEEASLESYHLNLYMESAVMTILIDRVFSRALRCIFRQSKEFEEISRWVEERDSKIAARWRQQLCILIAQDSDAMECRREREVKKAAMVLSNLVSRVYPKVDMSVKIKGLCYLTFELSFVMLGMESRIYPVSTPLGTPFDDTTMTTPQKSNPIGSVSLVIFPAFVDNNNSFYIKPKVWCF
ncbi:hypothetical protein BKA57DRAFT_236723 [Linnemannia elongata]|nr:hypothetical protein BKA57DRAFT_236723 [Linnemannia elongata]